MKPISRFSCALLMGFMLACGGGGGGKDIRPATSLRYVQTSASSAWKLVPNPARSTATHLVLDVVGPASEAGFGVTFELTTENPKLTWAKVGPSDTELIQNLRYDLGSGKPILKGVAKGNTLIAAVFQKGTKTTPTAYAGPLASVALDLQPGLTAGTEVQLSAAQAQELRSSGMLPIQFGIGKVVAD